MTTNSWIVPLPLMLNILLPKIIILISSKKSIFLVLK